MIKEKQGTLSKLKIDALKKLEGNDNYLRSFDMENKDEFTVQDAKILMSDFFTNNFKFAESSFDFRDWLKQKNVEDIFEQCDSNKDMQLSRMEFFENVIKLYINVSCIY